MLEPDLVARFTTHLKESLQKALSFAISRGRTIVEPGDLIVGLLQERGSIGAEVFLTANIKQEAAEEAFRGQPTPHEPGEPIAPDLSLGVKKLLEKCILTAHLHEHKYVGTEHLLYAILESALPDVHRFLTEQGMNLDTAREQIAGVLKSTSKFPDLATPFDGEEGMPHPNEPAPVMAGNQKPRVSHDKRVKALDVFARDLTAADHVSKLDPVIGREPETDRTIEILCRRTKNNPILLGEPGVGKTAIVEGLAQRLVAGDVPDTLQGKRIFAVDMALLLAGTMYRGEFEARLKQLVDEAKNDKDAILFVDEIHNIVGAGSSSGSLDAANILKPALARGEIHCIGATTWNEYKKYIEPDAALERRYQPVDVQEPSTALALQMVQGLKGHYEEHHGVKYEPSALEAAVFLADRYLTDRFFPDKAIDLLDEAASLVNAKRRSRDSIERLRSLDVAIQAMGEKKDVAIAEGKMEEADAATEDEKRLDQEKKNIERSMKLARANERVFVTAEHIAQIVARMSHVPVSTILANEREHLASLEDRLSLTIVGQSEAVQAVADTVRRARLGLSDPKRPKASFLFVGPSGVGKTELARSLAKEIFGREEALLKLDMSEFAEGHSISKLLGSPAGYVGFREGNRLADSLRKNPHAVLLLDEFEKAHPDVQHLLLQALEDGKVTDATGRPIPFRHTYIILTSNVGADFVNRAKLGFGDRKDGSNEFDQLVKDQLSDRFRPELLNRLDRVIIFKPLEKDTIKEIIRRELEIILKRLEDVQKVAYTSTDSVLTWLASRDMKNEEGARAARRLVEKEITSILSAALVNNPLKKKWKLKVTKDKIVVA